MSVGKLAEWARMQGVYPQTAYRWLREDRLAEWARMQGVYPQTAYRWLREDRMPVAARGLESGAIWVEVMPAPLDGRVVVEARVSSRDQRLDLDR